MKSRHPLKSTGAALAALAAAGAVVQTPAALAQTNGAAPAPQSQGAAAGASAPASGSEPAAAQGYADQHDRWAARNCVDQRTGNTAAGAIVGGALGRSPARLSRAGAAPAS